MTHVHISRSSYAFWKRIKEMDPLNCKERQKQVTGGTRADT